MEYNYSKLNENRSTHIHSENGKFNTPYLARLNYYVYLLVNDTLPCLQLFLFSTSIIHSENETCNIPIANVRIKLLQIE